MAPCNAKTLCNIMWLAWFQLLVLGLNMVPVSVTTAVEENKESPLLSPMQEVDGQDPNAAHAVRLDQKTAMLATVPHRDGLSGAMTFTGITHDAHDQGAKEEREGNQDKALKSTQNKDDAQRREGSSAEPSIQASQSGSSLPKQSDAAEAAAPCFTVPELGKALSALRTGQGRESEFGRDTLAQFGICTEQEGLAGVSAGASGSARAGLSALSSLVAAEDGDDVGPWGLHLIKELWVPGEEKGSVSLTFEVPVAFEGSEHLSRVAPTVLVFFVASRGKGVLEVTFNSELLLPNKQTACLSDGSQFIILTSRMSELGPPRLQTVQIIVESKEMNNGQKFSLPQVQDLMMRDRQEAGSQKRPLLVFVPKRPPCKDKPGSNSLNPTDHRTHEFLCELQKFLSDALPGRKPARDNAPPHPPPPPPPPPLQLSSLSFLPPLVLDASSSESLLSGLLSSSSPVLFSFPRQCSRLHGHRVALSLQPPLLSNLRKQLADALMRFQSEEVERDLMDSLQKLRALSILPEQVDRSEGGGVTGEDQYRGLLLLKALQTVLGVREADRAQRSARGGEESIGKSNACRLHSLTINLEAFFLEPQEAVINNCEGECHFPLPRGNNHAMLINHLVQRGDWAGRAPCCVPTEYGVLTVYELDGDGTKISTKTNMVALECGCR